MSITYFKTGLARKAPVRAPTRFDPRMLYSDPFDELQTPTQHHVYPEMQAAGTMQAHKHADRFVRCIGR